MRGILPRPRSVATIALTALWVAVSYAEPAPAPASTAAAAPAPAATAVTVTTPAPPTEITADTMTYDLQQQAKLVGHVKVVDQQMILEAEEMQVFFDQQNQIQRIAALGQVRISRDGNVATSGRAEFDVPAGTLILTDEPILTQGNNRISGAERVIYLRQNAVFKFEGGKPKIEFVRQNDGTAPALDLFAPPTPTPAPPKP